MAESEVGIIDVEAELRDNPLQLRLNSDGAYQSDLSRIRNVIRANGTNQKLAEITMIHSVIKDRPIKLFLNLAFQSNSQCPPSNASIYTLAFGNTANQWHFMIDVPDLPGFVFPGGIDGSYGSLASNVLPKITKINLQNAVQSMYNYEGGPTSDVFKQNLARLIIVTSEAIRINDVEVGVFNALKNNSEFTPPSDAIHNWGGHTLGDYNLLKDTN